MSIVNPNLFVISGGPGAGKTTALLELEKLGYPHVPEAARQIIREEVACGGDRLPWADREAFAALMLERSIQSFLAYTPAAGPTFADRGIPDTLGYARVIGLQDTRAMEDACREYRYAPIVFVPPPWEEIYRTDEERKQDFAEAERVYRQVLEIYLECGYHVVHLPKADAASRAQFMLDRAVGR